MEERLEEAGSAGVLIVDDEECILRSLKRLFINEEFPLFTASSGEQGLKVLRHCENMGLIISDQRMPGMMGAEFLARSREIAPEAMRIVLTGYADMETTIDAINQGGAYRYLTKPWNDDDLLQNIRDALHTYSLAQENKRLLATVQRQNLELGEWNSRLKSKVLQQTSQIRHKNQELYSKNRNLKKTQDQIIEAFAGLIEIYSKSLRNHARNVVNLSMQVAQDMGLSVEAQAQIHTAALLHDIGKIGTPLSLAGKSPREQEGEQLREYLRHAVRGQCIIDAIEELRPAGEIIRHHHERFDGEGVPDGCAGEQIPIGSRIIAMADHVDWCRRLRNITGLAEEILIDLEQGVGTRFDPELFAYFSNVVSDQCQADTLKKGLSERVVRMRELREGMILGEDLYSGTGLLLLSKGTCLDPSSIESIRRFQWIDPSKNTVTVLLEE